MPSAAPEAPETPDAWTWARLARVACLTLATLAVAVHVLGVTSPLGVNLAGNVVGVALGTLVRYTCYRYLVFTGDGGAARR